MISFRPYAQSLSAFVDPAKGVKDAIEHRNLIFSQYVVFYDGVKAAL